MRKLVIKTEKLDIDIKKAEWEAEKRQNDNAEISTNQTIPTNK